MRLAVYADLLYRREGDEITSSTAFVRWISGLSQEVDELTVVGRLHPEPGRADHPLSGSNVRFVPLPYYENLHRFGRVAAATGGSMARWRRELRRCDAVLVFGPHPIAELFGGMARLTRRPVVVGVRQDFASYLALRTTGWRRRLAVPAAASLEYLHRHVADGSGVIAVGEEMAGHYAGRRRSVLATGISLVSSSDLVPLDEVSSRPWPGTYQALSAGRLDPEKNPMLLLDVAERLRELGPWRLVVAGTGALAGPLDHEVRSRSLQGTVQLVGRLDRARLDELYRSSTVLVHVSFTEGQPQVLYEAAAAGLPIVATAVGGVPAALDHGTRGMLVAPGNASAMVDAVSRLGTNAGARAAMAEAAWSWAKSETLQSQVARAAAFIEECSRRKASR